MGANFGMLTTKNTFGDINFVVNLNVYNVTSKVFWLKKLWQVYGNLPNLPMFTPSKVPSIYGKCFSFNFVSVWLLIGHRS